MIWRLGNPPINILPLAPRCVCFLLFFIYWFELSGKRFGAFVPLVYVLASNKNYETYRTIFEQLKIHKPSLSPKHIMVDFEQAAISAASNEFPNAVWKSSSSACALCEWQLIEFGEYNKLHNELLLLFIPYDDQSDISYQRTVLDRTELIRCLYESCRSKCHSHRWFSLKL